MGDFIVPDGWEEIGFKMKLVPKINPDYPSVVFLETIDGDSMTKIPVAAYDAIMEGKTVTTRTHKYYRDGGYIIWERWDE